MADAPIRLILSAVLLVFTAHFRFIKVRRERPQLHIWQLGSFKAVCRRHQQWDDAKRLCVRQMDCCKSLSANNSTRQNLTVLSGCRLLAAEREAD
jgi:hypothetical protein